MIRSLIAMTLTLALALPCFAQGPSTVIVNNGSFNVNKVINIGAPSVVFGYPGYGYPGMPGFGVAPTSNTIQNIGYGNVNAIRNIGFGGAGAQNVIINQGDGNINRIINR